MTEQPASRTMAGDIGDIGAHGLDAQAVLPYGHQTHHGRPASWVVTTVVVIGFVVGGIALCVGLTAVAKLLEQAEVNAFGQPYLEGLVIAILLGVAIRTVWKPGPMWASGISFRCWMWTCALSVISTPGLSRFSGSNSGLMRFMMA